MAGIKRSVGRGGRNDLGDVILVQLLLNHHIAVSNNMSGVKPLVADGSIRSSSSDATVKAIFAFQRRVLGYPNPQGRVDPGGRTIRALQGGAVNPYAPRTPSAKVEDPIVEDGPNPVLLTASQARRFRPRGSISVGVQSSPITIKMGYFYRAVDGDRVVYQAGYEDIVFLLLRSTKAGRKRGPYLQPTKGFVSDITIGAAADIISDRTAAIHTAIELELHFLMGIAIGISWPAALFNLGFAAGSWYAKNKDDFPKWRKAVGVMLTTREILKRHAPVLYDKIFERVWKSVLKNVPAAMVSDKNHVATTTGEIVGRLGAAGFDKRLAVLAAIWSILYPVAKRAAMSVPHAVEMSIEDGMKQAQKMIDAFRKSGVVISKADAEKIIKEVANNSKEISSALKKLHDEFQRF